MLAAWGACFAQQSFDYMKPVNTEAANAELDAIKFKSLTEFLRPDPKSRIQQGTESDAYFKEYKAIGDVSESSRRQHDLPNHHERCFAPLTIYHHLHVPFSLVAGATDGHSAPSSASYWGISQIISDGDADDLRNGGWEDWGYGVPAEHRHPIDETDRLEVLAREKSVRATVC